MNCIYTTADGVVLHSIADYAATARHEIHKPLERELIYLKIGVNIRVVEFERSDDEVIGLIVKEFGSLVPIGAVVFVPFEDKFGTAAEAVALAEIFGDTTNQEIGALACCVEDPGEHGGGGGFAVGAGDDDGMFAEQELLFEDFGK